MTCKERRTIILKDSIAGNPGTHIIEIEVYYEYGSKGVVLC